MNIEYINLMLVVAFSVIFIFYINYIRQDMLSRISSQIATTLENSTKSIVNNINTQIAQSYSDQKKDFEDFLANIF